MDELYRVGERVGQDHAGVAGVDPAAFAEAMAGDPALAELLGGGGDIEQYLQSYEQMLQDGMSAGGPQLNQVDSEGGITVRPDPGFVIKTKDTQSGLKVFLNVVMNENVEAPHMKSFAELEGEEGCRVPLSVGTPVEDFDKKKEPCVTYDLVANPEVVKECLSTPAFMDTVVQLCLAAVAQKYKIELDARYKRPKITYKGASVQIQRLRVQKQSQIQEVSGGSTGTGAAAGGQNKEEGGVLQQPDFCIFYSKPGAPAIDGFAEQWGSPPDDPSDVADVAHLSGLDLPCYRVNEFKEKIRGTMKNKADREADIDKQDEPPGESETREMLKGRTCIVQLRMPDLDRHVPALKQFSVEVSDECLRVSFPPLPRSRNTAAYAPLAIWWPRAFCSAQSTAEWNPKADEMIISLPADAPAISEAALAAFRQDILDEVF